jgi:NADH-quinone oxidoreductase subunit G
MGEGDRLLLNADRNPNTNGARVTGIINGEPGGQMTRIADGIEKGEIRALIVFGEDVTRFGLSAELLGRLELLVVSDILPNATTALAKYLLPGCAHAEKRGTFINAKGRIQRFWKAVEAPGDARPEAEFLADLLERLTGLKASASIEGLFNRMARDLPALRGLDWAGLGDQGRDVAL